MNFATKMADWGDECVGFEQQQGTPGSGVTTDTAARFHLSPTGVLAVVTSTVHYGGGALHQAEAQILLERQHARDLASAILAVNPRPDGYVITWRGSSGIQAHIGPRLPAADELAKLRSAGARVQALYIGWDL